MAKRIGVANTKLFRAATLMMLAGSLMVSGLAHAQERTARVVLQFGIGYLPLAVMQARGLWEQKARDAGLDLKVYWQNLGNGSALNDAIITGAADIAAGGLTPMLKLYDKTRDTLKVRGIAALNTNSMQLLTNRPDIKSLKDFSAQDRIAVSVPKVSIQAVALQMAAAGQWGEDHYADLDAQTVAMKHPDALAALISPQSPISAYFASSPFQEKALQHPGIYVVLNSSDVVGEAATFSAVWTTNKFATENPELFSTFVAALKQSVAEINKDKTAAVDDFIRVTNANPEDRDIYLSVVNSPDNVYTTTPKATMKFAAFLARVGSLGVMPASWRDYFFEQSDLEGGS